MIQAITCFYQEESESLHVREKKTMKRQYTPVERQRKYKSKQQS